MKTVVIAFVLASVPLASAQLLQSYPRSSAGSPLGSSCLHGQGAAFEGSSSMCSESATPGMRAESRMSFNAKETFGGGGGAIVTMQARDASGTSFGVMSGGMYLERAGASIVPMFASVRQNIWETRGDGVFGAAYAYAGAGPVIGIGSSLYAPGFLEWLRSLSFRVGGGATAALGAEVGGRAFGWSTFVEGGVIGMAFTAALGPQRSYSAPFFALGLRRALGL